ncbi:MAG: T9SS type A sorting domain-containing protein [Candidatus Cloacimonadota bacterium]|nr:MAG: T9SS type A sorting domain-containing protein [Candidatus Cloacimonadota bacterium]
MKETKILCLMVLAVLLPSLIFSGESESFLYKGFSPEAEVVIARSENTKLFRRENGRFVWRVFQHPVHRLDEDGKFIDIDPFPAQPFWDPTQGYSGTADDLFGYVYTTWMHVNDVFWCLPFAQFNTSGIPDGATIDTVKLTLHCRANYLTMGDHDIRSMESRPSSSQYYTIYSDAQNGDYYLINFSPYQDTWYTWILGDEPSDPACVRMKDLLPQDWFAIGMSDWGSGWWSATIEYYSSGGNIEIPAPTAVSLVSFTASPDFDFVRLDWRTELEVDNFEWLIERKEEGGDYEIIATTPGQGTKPGPTTYSYIDRDVSQGKGYYYRLTDISTYGHQTIHTPIFVRIPTIGEGKLLVSPTMFKKNLSIKIRGLSGNRGTLSIFDKTGRVIKTTNLSGKDSPLTINWNGQDNNGRNVKSGVYFIRLDIDGSKVETKKVIFIK